MLGSSDMIVDGLVRILFGIVLVSIIITVYQLVIGHKYFCDTLIGKIILGD